MSFVIVSLILYIFEGFYITQTVYRSSTAIYITFCGLFAIVVLAALGVVKQPIPYNKSLIIWLPYLAYTAFGYFSQGKLEYFVYWSICAIIIFFSIALRIHRFVPIKLFYGLSIFSVIGILVQLLLPDFYYSNISPLFVTSSQIKAWGVNYGMAGFFYQLDSAAMPILFGECVYLAFGRNSIEESNIKLKDIIVVGGSIIFVLLTGKRMLFLISVMIPFVIGFFTGKNQKKRFGIILISILVVAFSYNLIINNLQYLYNNPHLNRIAVTFMKISAGEDISSGRNSLSQMALEIYQNNKLFGVGVSNFQKVSGAYTDVHNTYLQTLCEQGIVGFLLFTIPLLVNFIYTVKKSREEDYSKTASFLKLSIAVQAVYIIYAFTGNVNINQTGYMMYFILVSMMHSAVYWKAEEVKNEEVFDFN